MNAIKKIAAAVTASLITFTNPVFAGDAALFAAYDQVNSADIAVAELGVVDSESREVRALAAMVLRDHAAVRQMARSIAEDSGIKYTVPTDNDPATEHKATLERLRGLRSCLSCP